MTKYLRPDWDVEGAGSVPLKKEPIGSVMTVGQYVAYMFQNGIPEWHAKQQYQKGALVRVGSLFYTANIDMVNGDVGHPVDDILYWTPFPQFPECQTPFLIDYDPEDPGPFPPEEGWYLSTSTGLGYYRSLTSKDNNGNEVNGFWKFTATFSTLVVEHPTVTDSYLDADGETVFITFSELIEAGSGGSGGFTLNGDALTYAGVSEVDPLTWFFTKAGDPIAHGVTLSLNYVQPGNGIISVNTGATLLSFSGFVATNNSLIEPLYSSLLWACADKVLGDNTIVCTTDSYYNGSDPGVTQTYYAQMESASYPVRPPSIKITNTPTMQGIVIPKALPANTTIRHFTMSASFEPYFSSGTTVCTMLMFKALDYNVNSYRIKFNHYPATFELFVNNISQGTVNVNDTLGGIWGYYICYMKMIVTESAVTLKMFKTWNTGDGTTENFDITCGTWSITAMDMFDPEFAYGGDNSSKDAYYNFTVGTCTLDIAS